ncbi:ATP-grasp fold amidoligase family protein [uncultured Helicobacter sp.]|uniref:ATP-grasp fold amidoligase family protein n=1 Tax=uncultured Helicobacter sp. TaxID=175537 RepID=UPI003752F778
MSLKSLIRNNPVYQHYILPLRQKYNAYIESKLDDEAYFTRRHKKIFGYTPDFKNPQTFNEKIVHRILYDRNPLYTALADKLKARIYITAKLQNLALGGGEFSSLEDSHLDSAPLGDSASSQNSQDKLAQKFQALAQDPTFLDSSASSSPLFAPIDSVTKLLFETNICPFLPKLYGIYKSVEEIDFDALPQSFVLKTNHDCGGVVIVPDKEAFLGDSKKFGEAMAKLTKHLNTNFYTLYREYHYKDIEPRIFAEELLGERTQTPQHLSLDSKKIEKSDFHKSLSHNLAPNHSQALSQNLSPNLPQNTTHNSPPFKVPDDYKFHCFGEEVFSETIIDRGIDTRCTFFDTQWEPLPVNITYDFAKRDILKPRYLDTMYAIAKLFYQDMGYLRCDFYVLRTQDFYIGELTLTPGGGCLPIRPREYDMILGSFWDTKAP